MKKASLLTIFLTVFLDLLGFGLVVPFLPSLARSFGASDSVAVLTGGAFSLMQFACVPIWGRASDRFGRRPTLIVSIFASFVGMLLLAGSRSLVLLFIARLWSGGAMANIAIAQAYIADITKPADRARGMGMLGAAFGLGFVFGPFVGGELCRYPIAGSMATLPALLAAALSLLNFVFACVALPESLPVEARKPRDPLGGAGGGLLEGLRISRRIPGVLAATAVLFSLDFAFTSMEQIFALFMNDELSLPVTFVGRLLGMVGIIAAIMQGWATQHLVRRFGEVRLVQAGGLLISLGFASTALCPRLGEHAVAGLIASMALTALGMSMLMPSLSGFVSQRASATDQGLVMGTQESVGALARVFGPIQAAIAYPTVGHSGTYWLLAGEMLVTVGLARKMSIPFPPHESDGSSPAMPDANAPVRAPDA